MHTEIGTMHSDMDDARRTPCGNSTAEECTHGTASIPMTTTKKDHHLTGISRSSGDFPYSASMAA